MGAFSRLRYVIAANVNSLIEKAEDPEKLLRALIREMEDASEEARLACAELLAEQQHLARLELQRSVTQLRDQVGKRVRRLLGGHPTGLPIADRTACQARRVGEQILHRDRATRGYRVERRGAVSTSLSARRLHRDLQVPQLGNEPGHRVGEPDLPLLHQHQDGHADDRPHEIAVCISLASGEAVLCIEDDGHPFDPLAVPPVDTNQPINERPIGGLGIPLIRKMAKAISYQRLADKNRLEVRIDLQVE